MPRIKPDSDLRDTGASLSMTVDSNSSTPNTLAVAEQDLAYCCLRIWRVLLPTGNTAEVSMQTVMNPMDLTFSR